MMKKSTIPLIILCLLMPVTLLFGQRTFFVSATGGDGNDGSYGRPWRTINYGVGKLFPGDTLEIMGGTYHEWVNNFVRSGEKDRIITIRNYRSDRAVIDGDGRPGVIEFKKKSYYHFKGLEMTNAVWAGFGGTGYHHCRISECTIYNIGPSSGTAVGMYVSAEYGTYDSTTYNIIEKNVIHDCVGEAIYVGNDAKSAPPNGTPCNNNIIRNNKIYRCVEGVEVKTGSKYNKIIGNEVYDGNGGEHSAGVIVFEETVIDSNLIRNNSNFGIYVQGNRNRVTRNILYGNAHHGIYVTGSKSEYHNYKDAGDDNLFMSNTLVNNGDYGIWIWGGSGGEDARNNVIKNNIIANNGNYQVYLYPYAVQGLQFDGNDLVSPAGQLIYYADTGYSNLQLFTQRTGLGSKCLSVDPQFVSPNSRDYHLSNISPLIDRGVSSDLYFWGTAPDVGALEYIPVYYPVTEETPPILAATVPNASITTGAINPLQRKWVLISLTTSVPVVQLPNPLMLRESDGTQTKIAMNGTIPGTTFSGNLTVCDSTAEGDARFWLSENLLVDGNGNIGNAVVQGDLIHIHKIPPVPPMAIKVSFRSP